MSGHPHRETKHDAIKRIHLLTSQTRTHTVTGREKKKERKP